MSRITRFRTRLAATAMVAAPALNRYEDRGSPGGDKLRDGCSRSARWSDRRLKRDIRRLGLSASGLTIYSFRYVWGGPMMIGVMAQDLLLTRSDAVIVGPRGYMQVDYEAIDVKMTTLDAWLKARASV